MKAILKTALVVSSFAVVTEAVANSFANFRPSATTLKWAPCFTNFTCAVLEVPLDYEEPTIGSTNIAFIKMSSTNASAEDILVNPGGPGASGVNLVLELGDFLSKTVFGTQYNIVGFDPRGVNNSGIDLDICDKSKTDSPRGPRWIQSALPLRWRQDKTNLVATGGFHPSEKIISFQHNLQNYAYKFSSDAKSELQQSWDQLQEWSQNCTATQSAKGQVSKYANTVAVANDMLRYIEIRAKSRGLPADQSMLWYYGASYGTALGTTFASLFPNRIGRMILDGVVDADEYYEGGSNTTLIDTDKVAQAFFITCYEARTKCAFYDNASSAKDVEKRFRNLLKKLRHAPITVSSRVTGSEPTSIGSDEVKNIFFMGLYSPIQNFPKLARTFRDLEQGNGKSYVALASQLIDDGIGAANIQISCNDANGRFNLSDFNQFEAYTNFLSNQSFYGADISIGGASCVRYGIRPPRSQVFNGPVTAENTSSPILFISTAADPVTPLASAWKMSSQFNGSVVLVVDGPGHTSLSVKSNCIWQHIHEYLGRNKLPPVHTVCKSDETPFLTDSGEQKGAGSRVLSKWTMVVFQFTLILVWFQV